MGRANAEPARPLRAAVVGHVEWVDFVRVTRLPAPGDILHADEAWADAAGGGAVAAVELARLGADPVDFFCALGDDANARRTHARLRELGVRVHAVARPRPQRRTVTLLDAAAERTILVLGERLVPHGDDPLAWEELARADAVYFTGGDAAALRRARAGATLVATGRAREAILSAHVRLDALVASARDPSEDLAPHELDPPPVLALLTAGGDGGTWQHADGRNGRWAALPVPGEAQDAYGCGDCFASGLAVELAAGRDVEEAIAGAARAGAAALVRRGPYG